MSDSSSANVSRRTFLHSTAGAAAVAGGLLTTRPVLGATSKPALLGGTPAHSGNWPGWPVTDAQESEGLQKVLQSGNWFRYAAGDEGRVLQFEKAWSKATGAAYCQATSSGTSSLVCALAALDIGPGDEVIVPPYTFIATVNAVLLHHALPVFADTDPATTQIDPESIEPLLNGNTRALLPVHLGGGTFNVDRVLEIAKKHSLGVIEDACQSHTAEWRGKRVGSLGDAGCFSFQNSKNITAGEGGAMTTNDPLIFARAQAFQSQGQAREKEDGKRSSNGINLRLTEFQGALLVPQIVRNEEFSRRREENGAHLNNLLKQIPGVRAKATYEGNTRNGYHLYMFEYNPEHFADMSKARFLQALQAEGVPCSGGYTALNQQPFVEQFLSSRGMQRIYSAKRLKEYRERNLCPQNDKMIETTCWLTQNMLLGTKQDMEAIAEGIARIQQHAADVAKAG